MTCDKLGLEMDDDEMAKMMSLLPNPRLMAVPVIVDVTGLTVKNTNIKVTAATNPHRGILGSIKI